MNTPLVAGVVAGVVGIAAIGTVASHHLASSARVVSVEPKTHLVKVPREECHEEAVVHQAPVRDEHRLLGTGLGAAVGGILGHQIGGGRGNTLATVAGAAAGGYAGNELQHKAQESDTVTTNERRCSTVYDRREEAAGYDVVYEYRGERHHTHLDHDPGPTLPVVDGKVQTGSAPKATDKRTNSSAG